MKKIINILFTLILLASILLSSGIAKADILKLEYIVKFNPTGTHIDSSGNLKIRLDFYPTENCKAYDAHYISIDDDKYILTPALCVFIKVDRNIDYASLSSFINNVYDANTMSDIDNMVIRPNAIHLLSPYMRNKTTQATDVVDKLSESLRQDINNNLADYSISISADGIITKNLPQSIAVGSAAINRGSTATITSYTYVDGNLASNADGVIDTVELYIANIVTVDNVYIGTYAASGNVLTCYDSENIGDVVEGYQLFAGLSINILANEYIGIYAKTGTAASLERDTAGYGHIWTYNGEKIDPSDSGTFTYAADDALSLYGTGEATGGEPPTCTTNSYSEVTDTTAIVTGNITATSENCSAYFVQYGLSTGTYTDNETIAGNWPIGEYSANLTGLPPNTTIYARFGAINSYGNGYGSEISFDTESTLSPPTNFTITDYDAFTIGLDWTMGIASTYSMIRVSKTDYPDAISDGELLYYGDAVSYNTTAFSPDTTYYLSAWGLDSDNVTYSYLHTIFTIGGETDMLISHLIALIPLLVLFILSLIFYGKGLVHLITLGYALCLGFMAIVGSWEILFWPPVVGVGVIAIILFIYSMLRGDWL